MTPKSIAAAKLVDSRHEQTLARIAFQKWRETRFPLEDHWWGVRWDYALIDKFRWEPFLAGWTEGGKP